MSQFTRSTVACLCLLAGTAVTRAQEPRPPKLGIWGRFEYGQGLVVERVERHSPAGRLGLEPGDVIRAIDARYLRTERDYWRQLRDADFRAQLIIRDVRTGKLLQRPVEFR
jgi:S1-C subfamily serine protease